MKFYIDIGHGESGDPGACSDNLKEHDMNVITGNAMAERLKEHGHTVKVETGNLSINDSARTANSWGADFIISQHYNAGGGDRGEVIYSWNNEALMLANAVAAGLKNAGQTKVNTVKSKANSAGTAEYFGILRVANMPGVIIEPCFIDNATDRTIADTEAEQKNIGIYIANAIAAVYGSVLKEDTTFNVCIDQLVKDNVIIAADYWKNAIADNTYVNGQYVGILIQKMTNTSDLNSAVNKLESAGAVNAPEYWLTHAVTGKTCNPAYVRVLIVNGVSKLKL